LLDGNLFATLNVEIDSADGRHHDEGDVVSGSNYGGVVGTDFVSSISVPRDTISTDGWRTFVNDSEGWG
jgi:hypothetical protein